jgi:hypothetical protein
MGMRVDCKHYESRSYANGETVRKCRLDLAPEAPWACPADCPSFARRLVDVGWQYGSLAESAHDKPEPPPVLGTDAAAVLDEAEDIVNAIGAEVLADFERSNRPRKRFRRRKKG